jgi:hypothetical protein
LAKQERTEGVAQYRELKPDLASHRQKAKELDVAGFLVKPVNKAHFLATVTEIYPVE